MTSYAEFGALFVAVWIIVVVIAMIVISIVHTNSDGYSLRAALVYTAIDATVAVLLVAGGAWFAWSM